MVDFITVPPSESPSSGSAAPLGTYCKICVPPPTSKLAIIQRLYHKAIARELMPGERIHDCLRKIVPGKTSVDLIYDPSRQTAHYKNLMTCGSVWICPVCAARITEQRADELRRALLKWRENDGFIALVTFTLRHNKGDRLPALLEAIREAHRRFKSGAPFQRLRERYNWHGSVSALEVTHGENGWHPHLHELVFFEPLSRDTWHQFPGAVKSRWINVLAASNHDASWEHGIDVRDADEQIYDYIAKYGHEPLDTRWTVERELAKAPVKKSRQKDGRTPFQMLADCGVGDWSGAPLFQEYARTFKGRKQLVWSRGLREELGLEQEQSDDDLAAALPEEYVLLTTLNSLQWRVIMQSDWSVQAGLLDVAQSGDKNAVDAFLRDLGIA